MARSIETVVAASRSRRALAGMIDAAPALAMVAWRLLRGSPLVREPGERERRERWQRWLSVLGPQSPAASRLVGTPGERIMGLRTVDRRTGLRVPVWRALALAGVDAAALALRMRSAATPSAEQRQAQRAEWRALRERHADDRDALERAMLSFQREHPIEVQGTRTLAVALATIIATQLLRRRLAPTVLVRRRGD